MRGLRGRPAAEAAASWAAWSPCMQQGQHGSRPKEASSSVVVQAQPQQWPIHCSIPCRKCAGTGKPAAAVACIVIYAGLDPVRLLSEIRTAQQQLVEIADRPAAAVTAPTAPTLEQFLSGLRTAWHAGEMRLTSRPKEKTKQGRRRPDPLAAVTARIFEWLHVPRLVLRDHQLPARGDRTSAGARHPGQGRGGLSAGRPVREASAAHGRVGRLLRPSGAGGGRRAAPAPARGRDRVTTGSRQTALPGGPLIPRRSVHHAGQSAVHVRSFRCRFVGTSLWLCISARRRSAGPMQSA